MALLTLLQLKEKYPGFSHSALRNLFNKRKHNGLSSSVVKVGPRKMLVDEMQFEEWLESHREQDIKEE